ncbi:T9SS type A sorting domain-containing protein [candidate division KSB1 bacterium]|nr:T9SS type A sorting domain-containing protein [candidate division KSB1 bacterium]
MMAVALVGVLLVALSGHAQLDTIWTRSFSEYSIEISTSLVAMPDGGFVSTGYISDTAYAEWDGIIRKLDRFGTVQWSHVSNMQEENYLIGAALTGDGSVVAVGGYDVSPAPRIMILKFNSAGDTLWARSYGHLEFSVATHIMGTMDGGAIAFAQTVNSTDSHLDGYAIRLDLAGDTLWTRQFTRGRFTRIDIRAVVENGDGGYLLAGDVVDTRAMPILYQPYLINIDQNGDTLWTRIYSAPDTNFHVTAACGDGCGGYVISGTKNYVGAYLLRADHDGYMVSFDTLNHLDLFSSIYRLTSLNDGSVVISAMRDSHVPPFGTSARFIARLDRQARVIWSADYLVENWFNTYGGPMVLASDTGVATYGGYRDTLNSHHGGHYALFEGRELLYVDEAHRPPVPDAYYQVYPNPFNSTTTLRFFTPQGGPVAIDIFDLLGRRVGGLRSTASCPGFHEAFFDAAGLSTGTYWSIISGAGTSYRGKLVLLR